jgi:ApaG protein
MDISNLQKTLQVELIPEYVGRYRQHKHLLYLFDCEVTVRNFGNLSVRLLGKHWYIYTDTGQPMEIVGQGFRGKHPIIDPNCSFTYNSMLPLHTVFAFLQGAYEINDLQSGADFEILTPKMIVTPTSFRN